MKLTRLSPAILLALAASVSVPAQSRPRGADESVVERPAISKNPTFLFRTLSLSQESDRLSNGHIFTTTLGYTEPLRNASMSLGVSVPFAAPSPGTPADYSMVLSDIALKSQWIPHVAPRQGVLLISTVTLPTSEGKSVGTGKWSITPSMAYARFWGPHFLLAQFVQHQVSFAGPADRAPVNRTDLDLYGVYSGRSLPWWINADLNLRIDEADHNKMPSSMAVTFGRGPRKLFGGSHSMVPCNPAQASAGTAPRLHADRRNLAGGDSPGSIIGSMTDLGCVYQCACSSK